MNAGRLMEVIAHNMIDIDEKVRALQRPATYPYDVKEIKVKETHMSWVFLADNFVYKLKKPVKYDLLDHRTLESRLANSREEVRINKPLGREIYIGIVPLVLNDKGILRLEGRGEVIDWLVKMKRIPEQYMLDYAIVHDCVDEHRLQQAISLLTGFYKNSGPSSLTGPGFINKLEREISFSHDELLKPIFALPRNLVRELTRGQFAFLLGNESIFENRIKERKIIDTHGDLRPEHICLLPDPVIIDRLEFSKELRLMDIAEELSFLSMECEMMGNMHVGRLLIDAYMKLSGDTIPKPLINFYKIKKALVRAYLVARHIEENRYRDDPKWLAKANSYLLQAEKYHQQLAS